jgi:hypothetical protein
MAAPRDDEILLCFYLRSLWSTLRENAMLDLDKTYWNYVPNGPLQICSIIIYQKISHFCANWQFLWISDPQKMPNSPFLPISWLPVNISNRHRRYEIYILSVPTFHLIYICLKCQPFVLYTHIWYPILKNWNCKKRNFLNWLSWNP